jgi:hypothetical protein
MKRGTHLTFILLVFICLSLALLTAWQIWFSRERALHQVNVANLNLARALDNYSEGVIRQSELVLVELAERLEQEGKGRAHLDRLQQVVQEQSRVFKLASTIIIYNAKGDRLLVSRGDINARPNAADRAFFIHHRDNPSPETFIGPTIKSRLAHEWIFTVSRRLNDTDGNFSGVVAITLSVEHFRHLFGSLDLGQQGTMNLSTSDGTLPNLSVNRMWAWIGRARRSFRHYAHSNRPRPHRSPASMASSACTRSAITATSP